MDGSTVALIVFCVATLGALLFAVAFAWADSDARVRRAIEGIKHPPKALEYPVCPLCQAQRVAGPNQPCGVCLNDWHTDLDGFDGARRGWQ